MTKTKLTFDDKQELDTEYFNAFGAERMFLQGELDIDTALRRMRNFNRLMCTLSEFKELTNEDNELYELWKDKSCESIFRMENRRRKYMEISQ
jgi:hypothetical protein